MKQKRLNELTASFLINASHIAYLEAAEETLFMLECYSAFYRYIIRDLKYETLFNELEMLKKFVTFLNTRYNGRIQTEVQADSAFTSVFIETTSVICFFDSLIHEIIENTDSKLKIFVSANVDNNKVVLTVNMSCDGGEPISYSKVLVE